MGRYRASRQDVESSQRLAEAANFQRQVLLREKEAEFDLERNKQTRLLWDQERQQIEEMNRLEQNRNDVYRALSEITVDESMPDKLAQIISENPAVPRDQGAALIIKSKQDEFDALTTLKRDEARDRAAEVRQMQRSQGTLRTAMLGLPFSKDEVESLKDPETKLLDPDAVTFAVGAKRQAMELEKLSQKERAERRKIAEEAVTSDDGYDYEVHQNMFVRPDLKKASEIVKTRVKMVRNLGDEFTDLINDIEAGDIPLKAAVAQARAIATQIELPDGSFSADTLQPKQKARIDAAVKQVEALAKARIGYNHLMTNSDAATPAPSAGRTESQNRPMTDSQRASLYLDSILKSANPAQDTSN